MDVASSSGGMQCCEYEPWGRWKQDLKDSWNMDAENETEALVDEALTAVKKPEESD